MPEDSNASQVSVTGRTNANPTSVVLTPELARQVADRVFALLLADLKMEHERRRTVRPSSWNRSGGL